MNKLSHYLVGGAVRDELLGLPVADRDFVVIGASVEEMISSRKPRLNKIFTFSVDIM